MDLLSRIVKLETRVDHLYEAVDEIKRTVNALQATIWKASGVVGTLLLLGQYGMHFLK